MWFWVTTHVPGAATSQTSQSSHRSVCPAFCPHPCSPHSQSFLFTTNLSFAPLPLPHLPCFSLFSPQVFRKGVSSPVFFVASRGHHADIGGITPGSMPPHSTSLQQEGAVFTSFKLVTAGVFQEEGKRGGGEPRMNVRDCWKEGVKEIIQSCWHVKIKSPYIVFLKSCCEHCECLPCQWLWV